MLSPTVIQPQPLLLQPYPHFRLPKTPNPTTQSLPKLTTNHPNKSQYIPTFKHNNNNNNANDTNPIICLEDYPSLALHLQNCATVDIVRVIHAVIIRCFGESLVFLSNNLICSYVRFGELIDARKVFDEMTDRGNVVSWTAILSGYLRFGLESEALRLVVEFFDGGVAVEANAKTYVCLLSLCSRRFDLELGKQVHARVVKGNCGNLIVESALVYFYAQCGDLVSAFRAFETMGERDVVSWTTMITACSQHGWGEEAFTLFLEMMFDGCNPNEFTICSVLKACGDEKALGFGRQLHGLVVKNICKNDVFVGTSLVDMYAKCGEVLDSRMVFDRMKSRNTVTWTSLIAGYARNGLGEEAIGLFRVMRKRKIYANKLTMVSILKACGLIRNLSTGKEMHAQIIKNCIHNNIYLGSTLIWVYCKCGEYTTAYRVLEGMPLKDVVSWTALISGCNRLGHEHEALGFLKEMLGEGVEPNDFTYSSALKACARLENIWQGKLLHASINKSPALSNVFVGSSLVNMYAKCGYIWEATETFDTMPERNLISWDAIISCYAKNGLFLDALKLMYRMQAEGIELEVNLLATVLTSYRDLGRDMEPLSQQCLHMD